MNSANSAPTPPVAAVNPSGLAVVPGTTATCTVLTVLTVIAALFPTDEVVSSCLRALYTATLWGCFRIIRQRSGSARLLPFRLVESGFLLLAAGFTIGAVARLLRDADASAVDRTLGALEHGPTFLLGVSLISYGVVLLIAELLAQHAQLRATCAQTKGELVLSEHARHSMAQRLLEVEALRAIGELAAGVAHDLRNPLSIVKGAVDGLADRVVDNKLREHFEVIQRNLARAESTIQALLEVGRPQSALGSATPIEELLQDAAETATKLAHERGVSVRTAAPHGITVTLDRTACLRAVNNLITNALEASPRNKTVQLSAFVRHGRGGPALWIAVEDRGTGITKQLRTRLFHPFFTTKKNGTGLGLLSARRILAAVGGDVRLYPRTRGGARALMFLPLSAAPEAAAMATAGAGR